MSDKQTQPSQRTISAPDAPAFPPARRRLALWIIYVVLGVHVFAMIDKIDEWPLSYYSMYSRVQPAEFRWDVVYGVTADGREVKLQHDDYWEPIGAFRLGYALRHMRQRVDSQVVGGTRASPASGMSAVDRTIAGLMNIYESRRGSEHEGPPLAKLRLYTVTWRLDPRLANLNRPERRELVSEYVAQH
jgi:hypothetical protein